jgi:uncharacterized protein YjgD (DUF1641 family)
MTNEEKILQQLELLNGEIKEIKDSFKPLKELKDDLHPIINELMADSITKLDGLGQDFNIENIANLTGQVFASSQNLTEAIQTVNRLVEFKKDFAPYMKEMIFETVAFLDESGYGFEAHEMKQALKVFLSSTKNIAEMMNMINKAMEFKGEISDLVKPAVDGLINRLEDLQQKGVFQSLSVLLDIFEGLGSKLANVDFNRAKPVNGVFGLMSAMKDPEVQQGLGVVFELLKVFSALKKS